MRERKSAGRQSDRSRRSGNDQRGNAIALLMSDHRQVEGWFAEFEKSSSDERKADLAERICTALKVHTTIEEEIFYPAFLEATDAEDLHHEAEIEHDSAKKLIAEIESNGPDDDYFDARVSVLSEMIKHHVAEEEKRGGMFAKARKSSMDLKEIGRMLEERKKELEGEAMPREAMRQGEMPHGEKPHGDKPHAETQRGQMSHGPMQRGHMQDDAADRNVGSRPSGRDFRRGQPPQQRPQHRAQQR